MTGFERIPRHWACLKCTKHMEFSELYFYNGRLVGVKVQCFDCRTSDELWVGRKKRYDMRQMEMV